MKMQQDEKVKKQKNETNIYSSIYVIYNDLTFFNISVPSYSHLQALFFLHIFPPLKGWNENKVSNRSERA